MKRERIVVAIVRYWTIESWGPLRRWSLTRRVQRETLIEKKFEYTRPRDAYTLEVGSRSIDVPAVSGDEMKAAMRDLEAYVAELEADRSYFDKGKGSKYLEATGAIVTGIYVTDGSGLPGNPMTERRL